MNLAEEIQPLQRYSDDELLAMDESEMACLFEYELEYLNYILNGD